MAVKFVDASGHEAPELAGTALVAGLTGSTTAGTISPLAAGAGAGSTVTAPVGNDRRGSFALNAAGTPAAGVVAVVLFATPYAAAPAAVNVSAYNVTDTTASITVGAAAITASGFSIVSTIPTTAKSYLINYVVSV